MTRLVTLLLAALALGATSAATAHSHKKKSLEVVHPWTAAMLNPNIENISVYMTIKNRGKNPERLLRVETSLAQKVELIDMQNQAGMKLPSPVNVLVVPSRGALELNADGPRLLLKGFTKRLNAYDTFKLTLVFEKTGRMPIDVMVEEASEDHKH